MNTLLNRNQILVTNDFVWKIFSSTKKAFAEFYTLKFFQNFPDYQVPKPVLIDSNKKGVRSPYLKGVLLIKFLRELDKLINDNQFPYDVGQSFIINSIEKSLKDLQLFHSRSNEILETFPLDLLEIYPYHSNLVFAINFLAQILDISLSSYKNVIIETASIGRQLEKEANVLFRDAGLYNQIILFPPEIDSLSLLFQQLRYFDSTTIANFIHQQSFHIDFETAYQFICPADDYSLILESSISNSYNGFFRQRCLSEFGTNYYLSTIYRYIRVASRHTEYFLLHPSLYIKRYEHYGSALAESPLYYLNVAQKMLRKLSTIDFNYSYFCLESFLESVRKKLAVFIKNNSFSKI